MKGFIKDKNGVRRLFSICPRCISCQNHVGVFTYRSQFSLFFFFSLSLFYLAHFLSPFGKSAGEILGQCSCTKFCVQNRDRYSSEIKISLQFSFLSERIYRVATFG